jgi:hypothetical protein
MRSRKDALFQTQSVHFLNIPLKFRFSHVRLSVIYDAKRIEVNMKSSTIRRSNLSREKMAVIEALSKYRQESYDESPNVYVRPAKEQELDVLWQNFKVSQKAEKSPNIYLATGFVAGAVSMLILTLLISFSAKGIEDKVKVPAKNAKSGSVNFIPASSKSAAIAVPEVYTVKSGDTIDSILIRFYGSYSKEKQIKLMNANTLTNPHKLSVGQKLTIPME